MRAPTLHYRGGIDYGFGGMAGFSCSCSVEGLSLITVTSNFSIVFMKLRASAWFFGFTPARRIASLSSSRITRKHIEWRIFGVFPSDE